MHQDHFRSVVHRSLSAKTTSRGQDRNETVQCGRIRTSKTSHSVPAAQIDARGHQESKTQMADSMYKAWSLAGARKNIKEDAPMGAMDFHESLAMLEKIQSASKRLSYLSMKMKHELLEERAGKPRGVTVEASDSVRYNVPSRSHVGELKKASSSQSLRYPESKGSDGRSVETEVEILHGVCPCDQSNKAKAPNLIAKLMGLEEEILSGVHLVRKQEKMESIMSPRAIFDIGMPKSRKPELWEESLDPSRKALKEVIETMHFKGLLKGDRAEEHGVHAHLSENLEAFQDFVNSERSGDASPDGIMKPIENVPENNEVNHIQKTEVESYKDVNILSCSSHKRRRKERITLIRSSYEQKQFLAGEKIEVKEARATRTSPSYSEIRAEQQHGRRLLEMDIRTIPSAEGAFPNDNAICRPKCILQHSSNLGKKNISVDKKPRKPANSKAVSDQRSRKDGKSASPPNKNNGASTANSIPFCIVDCKMEVDQAQDQTALSEVITTRRQIGDNSSTGEPTQFKMSKLPVREAPRADNAIAFLLLSSCSFLIHAQKFFGLDNYLPLNHHNKCAEEVQIQDHKLYFDSAEEIMGRKWHQQQQPVYPLLRTQVSIRLPYFLLEELVNDITNSIAKLNSYTNIKEDATSKVNLYRRLERDLRCTDTAVSAMWDVGWVDRICMEEAGEVIDEVGGSIFFWLMEEACMDISR